MASPSTSADTYYVPHGSYWPFLGSVALFVGLGGCALLLNDVHSTGMTMAMIGLALLLIMLFGWFGDVVRESVKGMYSSQVDTSFRMGMVWFIFSEVMFFAAFFGALYYARHFSVPWLSGEGDGFATQKFLWDGYTGGWPTNGPADMGGNYTTMPAWTLPFLNTCLLLTSGVTITFAHLALRAGKRLSLILWLLATIVLGTVFLFVQGYEYIHAYRDLGLTLGSGIYGSTFFMLTGFHGMHVTLGTIMLIVILARCIVGHFTKDQHFGFEAVAWYWHFVDVVWLGLFVFVYVL